MLSYKTTDSSNPFGSFATSISNIVTNRENAINAITIPECKAQANFLWILMEKGEVADKPNMIRAFAVHDLLISHKSFVTEFFSQYGHLAPIDVSYNDTLHMTLFNKNRMTRIVAQLDLETLAGLFGY
jgi:hypothetical protein